MCSQIYWCARLFPTVSRGGEYFHANVLGLMGNRYSHWRWESFWIWKLFQSLQTFNAAAFLYVSIFVMMFAGCLPFCYYGTITLSSLIQNSDRVYNALWYKLPARKQHKLLLLMMYAQKERIINGFGLIACSMPTMLKVKTGKLFMDIWVNHMLLSTISDYAVIVFDVFALQRLHGQLKNWHKFLNSNRNWFNPSWMSSKPMLNISCGTDPPSSQFILLFV